MRRIPLTLALLLIASACVWASSADDSVDRVRERIAHRPAAASVADRLFCGRSISGGGVVTDAQIETFLDEVVEPRFPDGFTVWQARGQWRGGSEETLVLEIVHADEPSLDTAVREIAAEYRRRFRQETVLRVTTPAEIAFLSE